MKAIGRILFAALFVASLIGCRGPEGPEGPMGPRGYAGENGADGVCTYWDVFKYDVPSEAWVYNHDWIEDDTDTEYHGYWAASVECKELTKDIYEKGIVMVTVMAKDFQAPLPYLRVQYDADGNLWTQYIDYEYYEGGLNFYITNSDLFNVEEDALDYCFRVQLIM